MGPLQSYFDNLPREELEDLTATHRRDDIGKKAQIALDKLSGKRAEASAERHHQESIAVDRSARNIGWAAFGVSILALVVAVVALPQVQSRISPPPIQRLQSNSAALLPGGSIPAAPVSSTKDGSATSPMQRTHTKESEPPPTDEKPKALPSTPKE